MGTTISVHASAPDLRYVAEDEPGWHRRRRGRGFEYTDLRGRIARTDPRLDRVRALAIPPAWTDVWICADGNGHIQATGRDTRRRKQYRYHTEWRAFRDRVKFDRMLPFGRALPDIRRNMETDLRRPGLPREKLLATVVRLLETTSIRVGNEEYARTNGAFGLTTLRHHHARVANGGVEFRFQGKGGRAHDVRSDDPRIARIVHRCQELPGQVLLQYLEEGVPHAIGSHDANEYLRAAAGIDVTAKDYRTWMATVRAASLLGHSPVDVSERDRRALERATVDATAETLGNTPAICRASYIHPVVFEAYEHGELERTWSASAPRSPTRSTADERRVLALLRSHTSARHRRSIEALSELRFL